MIGAKRTRARNYSLWLLLPLTLLTACQLSGPAVGPQVAANTPGAGALTRPGSDRVLWIMPSLLQVTGNAYFRWPSGETYRGEWLDGKRHGQGSQRKPDGWHYTGAWENDKPHGQGTLTHPNGDTYLGNLHQGLRQGTGKSTQANGNYQGQWLNDLPHGSGRFVGTLGDRYEGGYLLGQRSGNGTSTAKDGSRYVGDWQNNQPHGQGELQQANGATYLGSWQQGLQQGYGRYQDQLGTNYQGTWEAGKYFGYGELQRADGSRYQGDWLQGLRHGTGTEFFAEGGQHQGEWANNRALGPGTRITRNQIEIHGVFTGDKVSHGLLRLPGNAEYAGPLFRKQMTEVAPKLLSWVTTLAQQDNSAAQLLLGTFYQQFVAPPADVTQAVRWYRAAARELPDAQYRLAVLLLAAEPKIAVPMLQQAAEAGHRSAQYRLAELYRVGQAVSPNATTANRWYQAASLQLHLQAKVNWAWLLATSQEAHARNPQQALALVEPMAQHFQQTPSAPVAATAGQQLPIWQVMDTLAAARAALGDFAAAQEAQRQALAALANVNVDTNDAAHGATQAPSTGAQLQGLPATPTDLHQALTDRLKLYLAQRPYVEVLATAE